MNNRLSHLYHLLASNQQSFKISDLASRFNVSTRTVYNDLAKLNEIVSLATGQEITVQQGIIAPLQETNVDIDKLLLNDLDFVSSNKNIRQMRIKEFILLSSDHFSTEALIKSTHVSKNTLINDLKTIKVEFEAEGIQLLSAPFKGYQVIGDEFKIRNLIVAILKQDPLFFEKQEHANEKEALEQVGTFLEGFCEQTNIQLSDESFEEIQLFIWVMKKRIATQKEIPADYFTESFTQEEVFLTKEKETLEEIFANAINHHEMLYLANKLSEASIVKYGEHVSEKWLAFNLLTEKFILEVEKDFEPGRFRYDKKLFESLVNHLRPAYRRALSAVQIENPMLEYVTSTYEALHDSVTRSIQALENELDVTFNAHEVSFFTLLFAASLEKSKQVIPHRMKVILVCNVGISTSEILRNKLENQYEMDILGTFSIREGLTWLEENNVDLVITTAHLKVKNVPVIQVSPFLSDDDMKALANFITPHFTEIKVEDLMNIIQKYVALDGQKTRFLMQELSHYLNVPSEKNILKKRYQPMLKEILTEELIAVNFTATNRDEAVKKSGELLLKQDLIEERYIDAMLKNIEASGVYIVIAPGIAMPHARPEQGAIGIGFSIVTLTEPVVFGHPKNDPVSLVIGLCAVDHHTHLRALAELSEILADEENVKAMLAASSPKEIIAIIERRN